MIRQYGYLEDFINELRFNGKYTFSLQQVRSQFEQSVEASKKALERLRRRKKLSC